jgi:4-oxalocrotonate tautomerase
MELGQRLSSINEGIDKSYDAQKEYKMPHIIVKMYPGRTEKQKAQLAQKITEDIMAIANCEEKSVSVAIEEIKPEDWVESVYKSDILEKMESLYKKPGYDPFEKQS